VLGGSARKGLGRLAAGMGVVRGSDLDRLRAELRAQEAHCAARVTAVQDRFEELRVWAEAAASELASLRDLAAIDSVSRWIDLATLTSNPLISVVLPTHNRPDLLERSVGSVLAQRYENWELLVVDDGGDGSSRAVVEAFDDERIRWHGIERSGVCGARNHALTQSSGELIAYLDDDNLMDPRWLYAVAWAFEQRPEVDVLYGAFVVDDPLRVSGEGSGELPRTFLHPWSRETLREHNVADMSAIAHRGGLRGAWFDEELKQMGDWDLLLRLTADRDPLMLPVVACYYTTDAPDRLTNGPTREADDAKVRERAAAMHDA
jgi:hypothetical protein